MKHIYIWRATLRCKKDDRKLPPLLMEIIIAENLERAIAVVKQHHKDYEIMAITAAVGNPKIDTQLLNPMIEIMSSELEQYEEIEEEGPFPEPDWPTEQEIREDEREDDCEGTL